MHQRSEVSAVSPKLCVCNTCKECLLQHMRYGPASDDNMQGAGDPGAPVAALEAHHNFLDTEVRCNIDRGKALAQGHASYNSSACRI